MAFVHSREDTFWYIICVPGRMPFKVLNVQLPGKGGTEQGAGREDPEPSPHASKQQSPDT